MQPCICSHVSLIFYFLFVLVCLPSRNICQYFQDSLRSLSANKIIARVYNHASLWLTTLAAGTSTALATMSVCNRDVRSFICLSPSIGTASINFCVTSYADEIRLAVIADSNIVPDPHFFTECFLHQVPSSIVWRSTTVFASLDECRLRSARASKNSR